MRLSRYSATCRRPCSFGIGDSRIQARDPHQMNGEPQQLVAAEGDIELGFDVIAD